MADAAGDLDLSRFWDDVARGGAANSGPLDPETAAAIRRLHRLTAAPLPGQARERVWRRLMATNPTAGGLHDTPATNPNGAFPKVSPNGRTPRSHALTRRRILPDPRRGDMTPVVRIALALLLLVGLIGGWALAGAPWPGKNEGHAAIPAPAVTPAATPDPATYTGVLIDTVIADQPLTSQYIDVEEYRFNPGNGSLGNDGADSNFVEFVTQGEISLTADRPTIVVRGLGGAPQSAPANVKIDLKAGDAIAVGPRTTFMHEHTGASPAVLISFNLLDPNIGAPNQSNDTLHQIMQGNGNFKPGPLRLVVRRFMLAPGENYSTPASKIFMLMGPEDPSSSITGFLMGSATNGGTAPASLLVMTLEPVGEPTGTLVYTSASPTP